MKTIPLTLVASIILGATAPAQVSTTPVPIGSIDSSNSVASASANSGVWEGTIKDWHSTDWQMSEIATNSVTGQLEPQVVRSFTEVGGSINYIDENSAWRRSVEEISLMTNGIGASVTRGPTKILFSPTLAANGPTIHLVTCSNVVLQIQPVAIFYVDDLGNSALLATLRPDAEGELVPPNRAVYRSVTTNGILADISFTYGHGGVFESDLILLSQPSVTPDTLGLDISTARISLVYMVNGPMPGVTSMTTSAGLVDSTMNFPGLTLPQGYAFSTGDTGETNTGLPAQVQMPGAGGDPERIPVAKSVIPIGFQQWGLAEDVRWVDILPKLEALPPMDQGAKLSTPLRHAKANPGRGKSEIKQMLVETARVNALRAKGRQVENNPAVRPKPMKVASSGYRPKGVDWDFISVVGGTTYSFNSGQTYFLSAPVTFTGTVDFFGDCVIKETNGAYLSITGPVNTYGTAANPSIITSISDLAFGENNLPGSTGNFTYSGNPALRINYTNSALTLNGLKIRWAQTGLEMDGNGSGLTHTLANSSIEWCSNGVFISGCVVSFSSSSKCTVTNVVTGTGTWGTNGTTLADECIGNDGGLPKSWEFQYFGATGISATGDPDNDGFSNQAEYTDGTNPLFYDGPKIQTQPQSQTVVQGGLAAFSVGASGTGTLSYQWYKAGQAIVGATNSGYNMSNVQFTNCENYFVIVTNLYGIVSSASAFLSVSAPTNGVPAPSGIVGWWPGNTNANDAISTNNGSFSGNYVSGEVGQGFSVVNSGSAVRIPSAPALNLGLNNGFSVETWLKPADLSGEPVLEWAPTNSLGAHIWINFQGAGAVWVNLADTFGNYHVFQSALSLLTYGSFQHLAVTYDKTSGYLQVLVNGVLKTNYLMGIFTPKTTPDLWLGCRPSSVNGSGANFNGVIDEMSIYSRVLSTNEIATIYSAGSYGKYLATAPTLTSRPQGQMVNAGGTTNFTITATGTTPFTYLWMFNDIPIAGATTSSCTITNIQAVNRGLYTVIVANTGGSARSLTAYLSLTSDYNTALIPSNIISWWRGEGNANDTWGTNNGQWQGTANYTNGEVGQAFRFSGTTSNYVQIPNSATLQLTNQFTIELWYNDNGLANGTYGGLFAKRPLTGACNFGVSILAGTPNETVVVYFLDPNYNSGNYQSLSFVWQPTRSFNQHIAATYRQVNSTQIELKIYLDGQLKATQTFSGNLANTLNTAPATIGASNYNGEWFFGAIDDLAIYSRMLTDTEINGLYSAGPSGKSYLPIVFGTQPQSQSVLQGSTPVLYTLEAGTQPMLFQWRFNGTPIAGVTVDEMWITNIQPANAGDYYLFASNVVGAVSSATATITVLCPPSISVQPASQAAPLGANVTFTVTASGTLPLAYQWNVDGVPIPGAMSSTYNIPNVQLGNLGNYSVLITNLYGSTLSTNAALSYSGPCTPSPSGIVSWWCGETNANDTAGVNNGIFSGAYTNGEVGQAFTVTNGNTAVRIPASGSLNVGTNGGFTIEGWVENYDNVARPVFEWGTTNTYGVHVWANYPSSGILYANVIDTGGGNHNFQSSSSLFTSNSLLHVALTFDKASATAKLYLNGNVVGTTSTGSITPRTSADFYLGYRPYSSGTPFNGIIDEAALYNRALGITEIQSIYFSGASGKCSSEPAGSLWVTITTPTSIQQFTNVASVPLSATVADNAGTVTNLQFFFDNTSLIGTATVTNGTNFNLTWTTNLAPGYYPIMAFAKDNLGVSNASRVVVFKVNPTNGPPSVYITSPTNGAVFPAGANLTITATAGVGGGVGITNVQFFQNTNSLGNDSLSPYQIDALGLLPGTYMLSALATDAHGLQTLSSNITVTVQQWQTVAVSGSWDPAFHPTNWTSTPDNVDAPVFAAFGSSNEVYVSDEFSDDEGLLHFWNNCGWANLTGVGDIIGINVLNFQGPTLLAGDNGFGGSYVQQYYGNNLHDMTYQLNGPVYALQYVKGELYSGGDFQDDGDYLYNIAEYAPPSNWIAVSSNVLNGPVRAIAAIGDNLYVGGDFTAAGNNSNIQYIARLSGTNWVAVGSGVNSNVFALAVWNGQLLVGGGFTQAGGTTNINGLAKWDGTSWSGLGATLKYSGYNVTNADGSLSRYGPSVQAIAVYGNDVFVGGIFDTVSNTTTTFPAGDLAHVQWNPNTAAWSWYDLDRGVNGRPGMSDYDSSGLTYVSSLALHQAPGTNTQELIVGGLFNQAGSAPSFKVARWLIGANHCANSYLPDITITQPKSNWTNYPSVPLSLNATANPPSGGTINNVVFLIDLTNSIVAAQTNNLFYTNWNPGSAIGIHRIDAVVTDTDGLANRATTFISVGSSSGPVLHSSQYVLLANSAATPLYVLTNSIGASGVSSVQPGGSSATITIAPRGTNLTYQPTPNTFGTNIFWYTATNSSGVPAETYVTVAVLAPPVVQITNPPNQFITNLPVTLTIAGTVLDSDTTVTSVKIFTNGSQYASLTPSGGTFSTSWSPSVPGFYTFLAVATDSYNVTNTSPAVTIDVTTTNVSQPVALITSPTALVTNVGSLPYVGPYVVRNGQLAITGSAYSPDPGAVVWWQVVLVDPSNPNNAPLYNITPAPLNPEGFATNAVNNGTLGTNFDLSLVQNGAYQLTLIVQSEGIQASASQLIQVESNLKIGQFSFSEQDLVLPVSGIPLTVTRTYNSLNPYSRDFGYSWTYSLDSMDVQLDDQRQPVQLGTDAAPFGDDEDSSGGYPRTVNVRTGGGWDVTLDLPDGRRTTFAFAPRLGTGLAYAQWNAEPGVYATLTPTESTEIDFWPLIWHDGRADSDFNYDDVPGWVLQTLDGTKYNITRDPVAKSASIYFQASPGYFTHVRVYGPPKLSSIVQRSGDVITISPTGIFHSTTGNTNVNRSVSFIRDGQNRITAIYDPNAGGTNGFAAVQYVYSDSGNLIQVQKLVDRKVGGYSTNFYAYELSAFPHYLTSIINPLGVQVARNYYDSSGRLIATVDANNNTNQFVHNLTNDLEIVTDRMHHTSTYVYDSRGNVTAVTNALGGITLSAYDLNNNKTSEVVYTNGAPYATNAYGYDQSTGLLLATTNALGFTNGFTYNANGQMLTSTDARRYTSTSYYDPNTGNLLVASDALGNTSTNFYDTNSFLIGSRDAVGTLTTNYFDSFGNLTNTATFIGTNIFSTNSFAYDLDGNRTNSVVWRRVAGNWSNAVTTYVYDGQNRVVQTIDPDGGTNLVIFDLAGRQQQTIDKLSRTNTYAYDSLGRLVLTTFPDSTTTASTYDANGNRVTSVDQLGRTNVYGFDALNRLTSTAFADNTTNITVYDDVGRVKFGIDARGITNAFGYDAAGERVAVTNAWGIAAVQMTNAFAFDANGNQTNMIDGLARSTGYTFDPLNRQTNVSFTDGTKQSTTYDAAGRRVLVTDQAGIKTAFGYDGVGRLLAVTNGFGAAQSTWAQYQYDEAGNQTSQVDALGRTTSYAYDSMGRRIKRTLPGGQVETLGYDPVGNLIRDTNFNGQVITNQYDLLNRLTNRTSVGGYQVAFVYTNTGQRIKMSDPSGTSTYFYDSRDRLLTNVTPAGTLSYAYDVNGNVTSISSSTTTGTSVTYQYDVLNRLTNVIDARLTGTQNTSYGLDKVGNLQRVAYPNGVTNLYQYDSLNRLTNLAWNFNATSLGSFAYQLGATGNRTNMVEVVNAVTRTNRWVYDSLYRLTTEAMMLTSGGTTNFYGTNTYTYDNVGNRQTRSVSGFASLTNQSFNFDNSDRLDNDSNPSTASTWFDPNGNTTNYGGKFQYDVENQLTNANTGAVVLVYNGDGQRVKKVVSGGATTLYLVDTRNPSGYAQVLEELAASNSVTCAYTYGLALISQRTPNVATNFYGSDGLGSVRLLLTPAGAIGNTYAYDAYGDVVASTGSLTNNYRHDGEQYDPELGTYYHRVRERDQNIGRFTARDSKEGNQADALSLNAYVFCQDNPVNLTDPTGRYVQYTTQDDYTHVIGHEFSDLIQNLNRVIANQEKIIELKIGGHGDETSISLDSYGVNILAADNTSITTDDGQDITQLLDKALATNAVVYLNGCNTAHEKDNLAQLWSRLLKGRTIAGQLGYAIGLNGNPGYNIRGERYEFDWGGFGEIGAGRVLGKKAYFRNGNLIGGGWLWMGF